MNLFVTGALQANLSAGRRDLALAGIIYLDDKDLYRLPGWRANTSNNAPRTDPGAALGGLNALVDGVARRRKWVTGKRPALVVSSNNILGGPGLGNSDFDVLRPGVEATVAGFIRALDPQRTTVVLHVCRQDTLLEHSYIARVMRGAYHRFAEQFGDPARAPLDYSALIERTSSVAGVENVLVAAAETFERAPSGAAEHVLSAVAPRIRTRTDPEGVAAAGYLYTAHALALAFAMNPHLETDEERRRVRRFLQNHFGAHSAAAARFLPSHERRRILAANRCNNRTLFVRYIPQQPDDAYDGPQDAADKLTPAALAAYSTRMPRSLCALWARIPRT